MTDGRLLQDAADIKLDIDNTWLLSRTVLVYHWSCRL